MFQSPRETVDNRALKVSAITDSAFLSSGSRRTASRGARRERSLQGISQPLANSLNDELRVLQMTILR